jgi:hypothetical protein
MAHYAYVVDGVVERVYVLANAVITDDDGVEQEALGQAFLGDLHGLPADNFIQCSYNGNFRGNYPGVGFTYDKTLDAFIPPKPYESWVLDEDTYSWVAPIPYPGDGSDYVWDESEGSWVVTPS